MCVDILPVHMFVHHVSAIPQSPEDGIKSPGSRRADSYEPPRGCQESNQGPLQEQTGSKNNSKWQAIKAKCRQTELEKPVWQQRNKVKYTMGDNICQPLFW